MEKTQDLDKPDGRVQHARDIADATTTHNRKKGVWEGSTSGEMWGRKDMRAIT